MGKMKIRRLPVTEILVNDLRCCYQKMGVGVRELGGLGCLTKITFT